MKKRISFNINFTKRALYTIISFLVILLVGVVVYAFGTSNPETFGHSAGELDLSEGVQGNAVFNGDIEVIGNGNFNSSVKIGSSNSSCTSEIEGTLNYNFNSKCMEICNATSWEELGC